MFQLFSRPTTHKSNKNEQNNTNTCFVFWPNGEMECFVVDLWLSDRTALSHAKNWLEILALGGTFVRASVVTNRLQTLSSAVATPSGRPLAVRVSGAGDRPLASVAVFGRYHDPTGARAALSFVANDARIADLDALQADPEIECGIAIATFGPKTDAAVDEAYGIGLCLGAAMNEASRSPSR